MVGVRFRDAGHHRGGAMPIISFTGTMVAQRISKIWSCCAVTIIGRCTTPNGGSNRPRSEIGVLSTDVDRSVPAADRREQPTDSGVNRDN